MQVILLEDVKSLGKKGVVTDVPEGYARNFLFPQHLAVEASAPRLHERDEQAKSAKAREKKAEREDKKLAGALDGIEVVIAVKKTDKGSLYAAVGPKEVAKAIKEQEGANIEADWLEMVAMKELGSQEVVVNFPTGVEAQVTVVVEAA